MAKVLEQAYAEYNKKYFGGQLPKLPVRWSRKLPHSLYGEFSWDPSSETIKGQINLIWYLKTHGKLWRWVLLHEMAHVKLWDREGRDDPHTKEWESEMRRLVREGAMDTLF